MTVDKGKNKKTSVLSSQLAEKFPIETVLDILAERYQFHPMDELTQQDPYKVLIACIMSLRTKDETTIPAAERLFKIADTPEKMVKLSLEEVQKLIFPVGFYKTKAQTLLDISRRLIDEYNSQVPDTIEELLTFKGVGRKTANLVVGLGYQRPAICVDVHVHRICNRLGYLETKTPDETEMALREKLPVEYWSVINKVMVLHGQSICKPVSPICYACPVERYCQKVNVKPRVKK